MRATVVVVNFNGGDHLRDCLRSVGASDEPVDVVVVDNASSDGSADDLDAKVVRNAVNLGFGAAANIGAREASTPYLMFLNPDATVEADTVRRLCDFLDTHDRAGAAGPLVLNPDGTTQPSKRAFPTVWQSLLHGVVGLFWPDNPGSRAYLLADARLDEPTRVDWLSFSALCVRREAFEQAGGFDERFFFFMEDVDLNRSMGSHGWERWFEPRARVTHVWGGAWTRRPLKFIWMHQRNMLRYVRKHHGDALAVAVAPGIALRGVLLSVRWLITRRAKPAHSKGEVLT